MTLDLRLILAFTLIVFSIISFKLVDAQSCGSIFALIKDLSPSQKQQIMVGLFEALLL